MNDALSEYLKHYNCYDCKLAIWTYTTCTCPLLKTSFDDDGKVRTTKRKDCPIKEYRRR